MVFYEELKNNQIYMCVVLACFISLRMSILGICFWTTFRWWCKQYITW